MLNVKPKIHLYPDTWISAPPTMSRRPKWVCHDDKLVQGFGDTPAEAYNEWRSKESLRTRVPRFSRWNRHEVLAWYKKGCPPISVYVGRCQVVSYDITTDELILRG